MNDKFLQELLKAGLFDIGDSDERLKWLQQAIADLQTKFEEDYSLFPQYTLVALDPNVSDTEPVLIETETILTTYWKALRGKYPEMPRAILRGVILSSLYNVGSADALAARIIYLTALNFYPYAKLNNEKSLIDSMLSELGDIAEENAIEEWSLIEEEPSLKLGTLRIAGLKFDAIQLDNAKLVATWREALENDPATGHGPQHGLNNQHYKEHFISKTTQAITNGFNSAFEGFNHSISSTEMETSINKFFADFKKNLDANLKNSFSSLTAVERRSKLLWWKETLYSPSLKVSYRSLNRNLLPIVMGYDLNNQVPEVTPISTDFLLRDTLYLLDGKKDELISFSIYLTALSDSELKAILKPYFTNLNETVGRISVTDFIALLVNDRISIKDFFAKTGINEDELISLSDLSVNVLHDLLTERLISE